MKTRMPPERLKQVALFATAQQAAGIVMAEGTMADAAQIARTMATRRFHLSEVDVSEDFIESLESCEQELELESILVCA